MAAPDKTTNIRIDLNARMAETHALAAATHLGDAMWWDEEVHLHQAQDCIERALKYVKAARKAAAKRSLKP